MAVGSGVGVAVGAGVGVILGVSDLVGAGLGVAVTIIVCWTSGAVQARAEAIKRSARVSAENIEYRRIRAIIAGW